MKIYYTADPSPVAPSRRGLGKGRVQVGCESKRVRTTFSSYCKNGRHNHCAAMKCECECHRFEVRVG
jgi:hypothetical protein